jgi:hypothetical protein
VGPGKSELCSEWKNSDNYLFRLVQWFNVDFDSSGLEPSHIPLICWKVYVLEHTSTQPTHVDPEEEGIVSSTM